VRLGQGHEVGIVSGHMTSGGRHILHVFPGFDSGGAQMRTVQLMGMMPAGTRHSILAMNGGYQFVTQVPDGVEVETLSAPPDRSFHGMGNFMADLLREKRPDAVMTYNWGSIEMVLGARRARFTPLIHHEDGFGPEESDRYLLRRIWIRRFLLRTATAVAVPSNTLRDLAIRRWRVPSARVHYLPNGVDLERFTPGARMGGDSPLIIGHVGHLRPEKNQRLLIEAFARSASRAYARLHLFGDGPEEDDLRQLVRSLGVQDVVEFKGAVADTAPVYREMDVFALSSHTEQMPLTVLEAMASGLAIVSTDVGDVHAMVDPSNHNLVVAKANADAFAGAIDRAVDDADLRRSVGDANRARCESEYDKHARYRAWVDLYDSLLS
jgi:glycosyltransferase involved in cell wall biosynthesis